MAEGDECYEEYHTDPYASTGEGMDCGPEREVNRGEDGFHSMSTPGPSLKVSFFNMISEKKYSKATPTGRSITQSEVPKRELAVNTEHFN